MLIVNNNQKFMIKDIEKILNEDLPDSMKESLILSCIARNKNAIPTILRLLHEERMTKDVLINEMNMQLSRTHFYAALNTKNRKIKKDFSLNFINREIKKFYDTYSDYVNHLFYGTKKGDKLLINEEKKNGDHQ